MSQPFFSILIPTKNRSFLVGGAIQSALLQTDPDFEVLLIDNDDSEDTRQQHSQNADPRFRYLRTGGLTMPDNWEYGYAQAKGQYVLLLEDKSVLKPRALATIRRGVENCPSEVVSWPQDLFNDLREPPVVLRAATTGQARLYSSDEVLEFFMTQPRGVCENVLPRGLNSAIHRSLIERIKAGPVGRVCPPVAPDFTIAFLQLSYTDSVLSIDDALTVYGSCRHSLGRMNTCKEASDKHLEKELGVSGGAEMVNRVPIKGHLASCWLYNDFLRLQEQLGGRLARFPLSQLHFIAEFYRDILHADAIGANTAAELATWWKVYCRQSLADRAQIERNLGVVFSADGQASPRVTTTWKDHAKQFGRNLRLDVPWRKIKAWRGISPTSDGLASFPNPLAYVLWESSKA